MSKNKAKKIERVVKFIVEPVSKESDPQRYEEMRELHCWLVRKALAARELDDKNVEVAAWNESR